MTRREVQIVIPVAVAVVAACVWSLPGQVRQIQGGNALDANPMVGSGGINYAAPPPPINRSNALMTRNVGAGAGFRGYSPIRDTSQFWGALPSSRLSPFNADGISVGDLLAGQSNFQPRLYYDPSRAVTSSGNVDRRTNPAGIPGARDPYVDPRRPMYAAAPDPIPFRPTGMRQPTGAGMGVEPVLQRYGSARLSSNPQSYNVPLSKARTMDVGAEAASLRRGARTDRTPFELEPAAAPQPVTSPLDRVLQPGIAQPATPPGGVQPPSAAAPGEVVEVPPEWLGRDLYRDLSAAAAAVRGRTLAASLTMGGPEASGGVAPGIYSRHASWVQDYLSKPLTTFVGSASTSLNSYLSRAEQDIRDGKYYRAASLYRMAAGVDPDSPLPLLGRAFALAAAGEYMTSVDMLCKGIERFPAIAYFRIDLKAFIADERVLDSRRAELERLLKQNDDYRLRFLLGYLEYQSGFGGPGLENLAKAALKAPGTSPISRFPELLRRGRSAAAPPTGTPVPMDTK